jgi:hypothetical protein
LCQNGIAWAGTSGAEAVDHARQRWRFGRRSGSDPLKSGFRAVFSGTVSKITAYGTGIALSYGNRSKRYAANRLMLQEYL